MSEILLGIDLGSTRTKVGLVTADGALRSTARARHSFEIDPSTGRAEQDANAWWAGLGDAVRTILTEGGALPDGICVTGQGPTLVAVDAEGMPVRSAITWLDTRPTQDRERLEDLTGVRGWSLGVLPAARWLERQGGAAKRARWYLNAWEAVTLRLTGVAATTAVASSPTLTPEVIQAAGLVPGRIAPSVETGSVVGRVTDAAARHLGLRAGTPVVAGLVDAFASFHGARMLGAGDAIDVGGAAGGFGVYWREPLQVAGGFTTPAPLPGLYSIGGAMAATGASLDWLAGSVLGGDTPIAELLGESASIGPGADGLIFLPYLAGERSPLWDPAARGAFVGLTLRHGRAHLTRAVVEAAALAIRHVAAPVLQARIQVTAMRACGGPAQDDGWNQIKADVTGFVVEVPRVRETAMVGAAIVAAAGIGAHADVPAAIRSMTAIDRQFLPDPARTPVYDRVYQAYIGLYPAIASAVQGAPDQPSAGVGAAA